MSSHWMFGVVFWFLLLAPLLLRAQPAPQLTPGMAAQVMVPQPPVDLSQFTNISVTAEFDPPTVGAGEKTFYRVTVGATQNSIVWPDEISTPPELKFGASARGQLMQPDGVKVNPLTAFVYEATATAPGRFVVSNFAVQAGGQRVEVPAASLEVVEMNSAPPIMARRLKLEVSGTNVFLGQPFRVSVMLPAGPGNQIEALRDIQLNGDGVMTDRTAARQSVEVVNVNGQLKPAFICEMVATPLAPGPLKFSAQGFTAGREFSGPISIQGRVVIPGGPPKYVLLVSDAVEINVRPLPSAGELPGFTGAIGKFFYDPPQLSKNRIAVGEPLHLRVVFHGEGDLTRLVPPAPPRSPDWQIIPDNPPDTGYTLIPLTDEARDTPAIPFSYFDPATAKYVDLTIPPQPVTVVAKGLPTQLPVMTGESESTAPLKLSGLAVKPGKSVGSLTPLQLRGWFVGVQLLPVIGFVALWQWDRRRRFLEAHPEMVRRRQARRALRREKVKLQSAAAAGDATAFIRHAADAMRIAVAPNYPANPQALVGGDVLARLDDAEQTGRAGKTVRQIFTAVDSQFAASPPSRSDLLALQSEVHAVLLKLEETL